MVIYRMELLPSNTNSLVNITFHKARNEAIEVQVKTAPLSRMFIPLRKISVAFQQARCIKAFEGVASHYNVITISPCQHHCRSPIRRCLSHMQHCNSKRQCHGFRYVLIQVLCQYTITFSYRIYRCYTHSLQTICERDFLLNQQWSGCMPCYHTYSHSFWIHWSLSALTLHTESCQQV